MRYSVLSVGLFLVLAYIGCGDVRLSTFLNDDFSSAEAIVETHIPEPLVTPGQRRVILIVDQSYSMLRAGCPQDLDSPNEGAITTDGSILGCSYVEGVDTEAHRWIVVEKWLQELADDLEGDVDAPSTKVALVPFSGGKFQRPLWGHDTPSDFQFMTIRQARVRLEALKQEHIEDLARARAGADPNRMGTSVPYTTMNYMKGVLMTEIQALRAADPDLLKTTPFEYIYISDGVYKPLTPYIEKAQRLSGCSTSPRYNECMPDVSREFRRAYGNPEDNDTEKIALLLNELNTYDRVHGTGPVKLKLVSLYPLRVPAMDFDSPRTAGVKNIFDAIMDKVPSAKKYVLESSNPPFSLHMSGASLSYRIEEFYAVNLNAYVTELGDLAVDSDGDGLTDDQERQLGSSATEYASGGAFCNDTLFHFYGCRTFQCLKDWDEDGDGLNECEEKSFDSDPKNGDTDADNILDVFEGLRRLNPRMSEAGRFTSGTATSDRQMFFHGISPRWFLDRTPEAHQVLSTRNELGTQKIEGRNGSFVTRKYQIRIDHIPLLQTKAASGARPMKRATTDANYIPLGQQLAPTDHPAGINQVLFLAKVVADENPELVYWFLQRKDIPYQLNGVVSLDIDLGNFTQLSLGKKTSTAP